MVGTYLVNIENKAIALIAFTWAMVLVVYVVAYMADRKVQQVRQRKLAAHDSAATFKRRNSRIDM